MSFDISKPEKSRLPTRKWWAMEIAAASTLITSLISGIPQQELGIALVGFIAQAAITYLVPDADAPGGVPTKIEGSAKAGGSAGG